MLPRGRSYYRESVSSPFCGLTPGRPCSWHLMKDKIQMAKKCEYEFVRFGWDRVTGKMAEKGPADDAAMKNEIRNRNDEGWELLQILVTSTSGSPNNFSIANGFELIFVREAQ